MTRQYSNGLNEKTSKVFHHAITKVQNLVIHCKGCNLEHTHLNSTDEDYLLGILMEMNWRITSVGVFCPDCRISLLDELNIEWGEE